MWIDNEQTESKESAMNVCIKETSEKVENLDEAAKLNKRIDKMIKNTKNNILMIAYKQGKIFKSLKLIINLSVQLTHLKLARQR